MKRLTTKPWFGPKRFMGWGWAPASWEGYTVSIIYITLLVLTTRFVNESNLKTQLVIGLTVILLIVTILTGDKPGWPSWYKDK